MNLSFCDCVSKIGVMMFLFPKTFPKTSGFCTLNDTLFHKITKTKGFEQ